VKPTQMGRFFIYQTQRSERKNEENTIPDTGNSPGSWPGPANGSASGGTAGDYNVRLAIDDVITAARQITLAPETSRTVSFTINPDAAGKHQVEVAGLTGDFEILGQSSTGFNWWLIGGVLILVLLSVLWLSLMRRRISS